MHERFSMFLNMFNAPMGRFQLESKLELFYFTFQRHPINLNATTAKPENKGNSNFDSNWKVLSGHRKPF